MTMPAITHNTRIATGGIGEADHGVRAYVVVLGDYKAEIRLDLNVAEPVTLIDLTLRDARRVIAILRASLTDAAEYEEGMNR